MATGQRLTADEITRVRTDHPVVDVLGRAGVAPPSNWDGAADFLVCCPIPDHEDSTPSCVIHPHTDRFNCFGCGARGDVLELVMQVESIRSVRRAAEVLDEGRALVPVLADGTLRPVSSTPARLVDSAEKPDLTRTPLGRVLAANAEAWRFLTLPKLAGRGRDYLADRGVDVTALEAEVGRPVVGHTPFSETGLVDQLSRRGFSADEIVDSGWGARRGSELRDRFRRRVMIPVRDDQDLVIGVYGRDVTGRANQKYLNTAETIAFHKGSAVYRPSASSALDAHATVIACEGSIDALAIASLAATAGKSAYFAAVSPSGTALTVDHARVVLAISDKPPLVCADGDDAGIAASSKWIQTFMTQGREALVTVLPDSHDPASWLRQEGAAGLCAFVRKGCLDRPDTDVKPVPAGALLAHHAMTTALATNPADPLGALPNVMRHLVATARHVHGAATGERFATAAGRSLADFGVGTEAGLRRVLIEQMAPPDSGSPSQPIQPLAPIHR